MINLDSYLKAPFPDAVCDLTELENLVLYGGSGLYGLIPSCITKMTFLYRLVIRETALTGPMSNFYNNTRIRYVDLSHNHLSGTIPSSLSTLPSLGYMDLSSNYLTGTIPSSFSSVAYLDLSSNYLTGGVPPRFFDHSYSALKLSDNNLTGDMPPYFGWSMTFFLIDVSNNRLSGDALVLFGREKSTYIISLGNNNF